MSSAVLRAAEFLEGVVGRRGLDAADAGNRQTTKLGPAHSHEAIGALSRVASAVVGDIQPSYLATGTSPSRDRWDWCSDCTVCLPV
jgi:hypothetical protein